MEKMKTLIQKDTFWMLIQKTLLQKKKVALLEIYNL